MAQLAIDNLKPLPGYVLVAPSKPQEQTKSGIYLPSNEEEKPQDGTVLAVGDEVERDGVEMEPPVEKGDHVIYKKWGGTELKIGDEEVQFLKFEDILATVE